VGRYLGKVMVAGPNPAEGSNLTALFLLYFANWSNIKTLTMINELMVWLKLLSAKIQ
jgi:hypothetical protein